MSKIRPSIVCAAALGFGLPSGALAQDLPLENRIWNGGFEEGVAATGIPRAWQQETDALYIPAPELVKDAFEGRFAVLLRQPTPWHHQRPQYLWQRVPALPGRPQVLRCQLKGAGLGYLFLQPMTAKGKAVGEPLLREVGLCEEYTAHQLGADMPEGADWVEVRIGTRRIFTDLYADAVFFGLVEDAGAAPEPEPESLAADAGLRNLAPRAQIEVLPPQVSASLMNAQHYLIGNRGLSALVDGDPGTSLCFSHCAERMGRLTFRFPAPVDVAVLRVKTTDVGSFLVRIDTDGDGRFDHVAARCEGVEAGWRRLQQPGGSRQLPGPGPRGVRAPWVVDPAAMRRGGGTGPVTA